MRNVFLVKLMFRSVTLETQYKSKYKVQPARKAAGNTNLDVELVQTVKQKPNIIAQLVKSGAHKNIKKNISPFYMHITCYSVSKGNLKIKTPIF